MRGATGLGGLIKNRKLLGANAGAIRSRYHASWEERQRCRSQKKKSQTPLEVNLRLTDKTLSLRVPYGFSPLEQGSC